MTSTASRAEPAGVVLEDSRQRVVFDALVTALAEGEPCAVLDPVWPEPMRRDAGVRFAAAVRTGRVRRGDLVVFSSGSTGTPRGIVRSLESWRASVPALAELTRLGPGDVVWIPGPLSSSLYLYAAYYAHHVGARLAFADEPAAAATLVHAVPSQLPWVCRARAGGATPRLRRAVVAGDRLTSRDVAGCRDAGLPVLEYYGAAELSFVGYADHSPPESSTVPGALRPFPGVEVEIRDGVVWARSALLARGYLDPDAGGPLRRDTDGWASVGDLAVADGAGGFVVSGRGDTAVTTGGHTVTVEEVEDWLRRVPGVGDVVVVGVPHPRLGRRLVAVVVGTASDGQLRTAAASLPAPARPGRYLRTNRGLRNRAGKLDRARWREWAGTEVSGRG